MTEDNYVWLVADYRQAETHIVAWQGNVVQLKTWLTAGEDVYLNIAKQMARVIQEQKIKLPTDLFTRKDWKDLVKKDPERQVGKTTVLANGYGMGAMKFALLLGLPEKLAGFLQLLYFRLVPEIKTGYQSSINTMLAKNRILELPHVGYKKVFYDVYNEEMSRAAYSGFAQMTVGILKTRWLTAMCELYDSPENITEQLTPAAIRSCGADVAMEMHDSLAIRVPNDDVIIEATARNLIRTGTFPLVFPSGVLTIPIELKTGPNLKELEDYSV